MRYTLTITKPTIARIKKLLRVNGIRETGRRVGVSYYTAWCVKKGKYDNDEPLQTETVKTLRCPITGFLIHNKSTGSERRLADVPQNSDGRNFAAHYLGKQKVS